MRAFCLAGLFLILANASPAASAHEPEPGEIVDSSIVFDSTRGAGSLSNEKAEARREYRPPKKFRPHAFTVSPLHLLGFNTLEGMFEKALGPHYSLAGIGAYGMLPSSREILYYQLAGQFRLYPKGQGTSGFHYGVEAFWAYLRLDFDDGDDQWGLFEFRGDAHFAGAGPFFGYKFTRDRFVAEFQAGYSAVLVDGRGMVPWPILNVNIGYAF